MFTTFQQQLMITITNVYLQTDQQQLTMIIQQQFITSKNDKCTAIARN
jgi:hypothetical protein